ncbi:MAG TPA: hypothetical protein VFX60_10565 [Micromonospora sp.]|nr:hypothetical protein [Micromonospora sp.]
MSENDRAAALERLRQARKALDEYTSTTDDGFSDPEWRRLNNAVGEAEKAVPFGRSRGWDFE